MAEIKPHIAAVARRGDTVLIGFNQPLSDEERDQVREDFAGFAEETGVEVGFVDDTNSIVVVKGD